MEKVVTGQSLGMAVVCAEGAILERRLRSGRRAEVQGVAQDLAQSVRAALDSGSPAPSELCVRFEELLAPLTDALSDTGIQVVVSRSLEGLSQAVATLEQEEGGFRESASAVPASWADLGLSDSWLREFYETVAVVQVARPWDYFDPREAIEVRIPSRPSWWVALERSEEGTVTINLHERRYELLEEWCGAAGTADAHRKRIVVRLVDRDSLPPAMEQEIESAGWVTTSSSVYPLILPMGMLAGGLPEEEARDLLEVLRVLAVRSPQAMQTDQGRLGWRDARSGTRVSWLPRFEEPVLPWAPPSRLAAGFALGAGAEPAARSAGDWSTFDDLGMVEDSFEVWLCGRLSPRLARRHLDSASYFTTYLAQHVEVPLRAIHELDLRNFLFDWYPRCAMSDDREALRMPDSLTLLFEFLATEMRVECPWAASVLAERKIFRRRWQRSEMRSIWEEQEVAWKLLFRQHLEDRLLLPCDRMSDGGSWSSRRTWRNAALSRELQDLWLQWREELVRGVDPDEILDREGILEELLRRQRRWESTPHPRFSRRTPIDVLATVEVASGM